MKDNLVGLGAINIIWALITTMPHCRFGTEIKYAYAFFNCMLITSLFCIKILFIGFPTLISKRVLTNKVFIFKSCRII